MRSLLKRQLDEARTSANAATQLAQEQRTISELTTELVRASEPPVDFPVFVMQPHDAAAYQRVQRQLQCMQRELKTVSTRNAELERQLQAMKATRAAEIKEARTQQRVQHVNLSGAVRRIHWLLFERERGAGEVCCCFFVTILWELE